MIIRKNASALTRTERRRYVDTIATLNSGPSPTRYAQLVGVHADMSHRQHGGMGPIGQQRFLSWHRDFLLHLETEMRQVDPAACIPHWKWSTSRAIPKWMTAVLPTVVVPAVGGMGAMTVQVTRSPHHSAGLPTASQIKSLDANPNLDYTQFTALLEGFHNTVHGWVGGTMNNIMVSPADPLFWMHHAEIDRIWSVWQANPANVGKAPTLTGSDAVMDPWPETPTDLVSIDKLGYNYR